ncbi:Pex3p [Sporobolomyces salmoneus]|uniref:Pex3p n=1 Tax=Sporobolomyces salmoneus TaxID=183962 RepID=UPI003174DB64
MISSLTSLPTTLASSTWSFLSNRKKTFAYLGATVGGAYAVGQWGIQRMMEVSERGRKQTGAKNDLLNRFNLNLQDAQFTVQALLPTVANQLQTTLDVEDRTAQLGEIAKGEKRAKLKELERLRIEKDEQERARIQQEEQDRLAREQEDQDRQEGGEGEAAEEPEVANGQSEESKESTTDAVSAQAEPEVEEPKSNSTKLTLNPDAPAFQPRFAPPPSFSTPPEEFPKLNGSAPKPPSTEGSPSQVNGTTLDGGEAGSGKLENGETSGLGKSWAEIVKTDKKHETAANGEAEVASNGVEEPEKDQTAAENVPEESPTGNSAPSEAPIRVQESTAEESVVDPVEPEPAPLPTKSKIQLWNEIKILSFTRLLTSIYVLSLLTLQTHVQLALLGRAHYVKSLIDSLPPRSPSPNSSSIFPPVDEKGKGKAHDEPLMSNGDDLEAALYRAKELASTSEREEDRVNEDVERKYLTFSWWLLHEGWKVVRDRVQEKVEEVVGPMALKTPVVYGELSALMGEIRRRIETQPDGSRFDFSAALHPPTPAHEIHTLVTGGGFPAPSPSSSDTSLISRPLRSLLNETSDFLLSPDGSLVLTLVLDRLLTLSISKLEPAFSTPLPPNSAAGSIDGSRGARFEDVTEKQTKLASLLPVLTRLSAAGLEGQAGILRGGHGNEFVEAIDDIRELREFVAIVYASYDRDNLRDSY